MSDGRFGKRDAHLKKVAKEVEHEAHWLSVLALVWMANNIGRLPGAASHPTGPKETLR